MATRPNKQELGGQGGSRCGALGRRSESDSERDGGQRGLDGRGKSSHGTWGQQRPCQMPPASTWRNYVDRPPRLRGSKHKQPMGSLKGTWDHKQQARRRLPRQRRPHWRMTALQAVGRPQICCAIGTRHNNQLGIAEAQNKTLCRVKIKMYYSINK